MDTEEAPRAQLSNQSQCSPCVAGGKEFRVLPTIGKPRALEELVSLSHKLDQSLKDAFGPFKTEEEARRQLQLATKLAFPIKLSKCINGNNMKNLRGAQRLIECTHKKCRFNVRYELVIDQSKLFVWYMERCQTVHSDHPMAITPAEQMAIPLNRHIPEEFLELGQVLRYNFYPLSFHFLTFRYLSL
jgi:hypothetical protein